MGAISPRTQLLAVDALMQRHHDGIAKLISAAVSRHNRLLSPDDAFQLLLSWVGHSSTATYWLQLSQSFRRIPTEKPVPHDESVAKSKERREQVFLRVQSTSKLAIDMMRRLAAISSHEMHVAPLFESLTLQLLCDEINATISARQTASGGPPIPKHQFAYFIWQLEAVRSQPDFPNWSASQQNALWITLARVHEAAGNLEQVREALRQRRALTPATDDSRPRLLMELLGYATGSDERLALIEELGDLPDAVSLGPIFSRERIGRMSVLHDSFWSAAISTPTTDPLAAELFDAAFACSRKWLFGRAITPLTRTVSIASSWRGDGRFAWGDPDHLQLRSFDLDPELISALYSAMDHSSRDNPKALRETVAYLDTKLAPLLGEAGVDGEMRVRTGGHVGLLPILTTLIDGEPLGARAGIAIAHPTQSARSAPRGARSFDLVVVDQCFAGDAAAVLTAAHRASTPEDQPTVLTYNSDDGSTALDPLILCDELQRSHRTLIYSHVRTAMTQANWAAVVLGPSALLSVEDLVALDLRTTEELVLIGCASGRTNPFVGDVTVAHAAAVAGAAEVFFTLWPIRPKLGSQVGTELVEALSRGESMSDGLSRLFQHDRMRAAPFAVIRP